MGIKVVLGLLLIMGGLIILWAQLGDSSLLATTSYLQEYLQKQGDSQEIQGLVRGLWLHQKLWQAVFYMGVAVFGLAGGGFFLLRKKP